MNKIDSQNNNLHNEKSHDDNIYIHADMKSDMSSESIKDADFKSFDRANNAKKINEWIKAFENHNLLPKLSKNEHVFAVSLAMLAHSLKWQGSKNIFFECLSYNKEREIDLLDILNTISNLGFSNNRIKLSLFDIDLRLMPCLFIADKTDHPPLVLLSKEQDSIIAFDSKKREHVILSKDDNISGICYCFSKSEHLDNSYQKDIVSYIESGKNDKIRVSWFSILCARFKNIISGIIYTSFFINILSLAMPLFTMSVYDVVIGSGSTKSLFPLLSGVAIAIIVEMILRLYRSKSIAWLGVRMDNIIGNVLFKKMLNLPLLDIESASISVQISRTKTFEVIKKFFMGPLFSIIMDLPFSIFLIFVIWIIAGKLAYIPIFVLLLFSAVIYLFRNKINIIMINAAAAHIKREEFSMETFSKIDNLHYNGLSNIWLVKYKELLANSILLALKSSNVSAIISNFAHAISLLAGLFIVVLGVSMIWNQQITIGALVATMILVWRILAPIQSLCAMLPRIEQIKDTIANINTFLARQSEDMRTSEMADYTKYSQDFKGNISVSNLGLRYTMISDPVFMGVNFELTIGETLAITGTNGSGKTSLLKLLNGLYQAPIGTISIDGINIKQLDTRLLRNYIDYMPQMPDFFTGTIKENLLLFNPFVSDEDIEKALIQSGAISYVKELPDGINTIIYSKDNRLSGDFMYMLGLARIFLKNSPILLLDEVPNAVLNGVAGASYKNAIVKGKSKKTIIFVTQRKDYIKLADKVLILNYGQKPLLMDSKIYLKDV